MTWAACRDVTSLDPVYGSGYLENTADWLMCESPLRQTPDGAVVPGLASLSASTGDIIIEGSFAPKQGQNQVGAVLPEPGPARWSGRTGRLWR